MVLVVACSLLNVPLGHESHPDWPSLAWNVPASQMTQLSAAAPEYVPAGQLPQLLAPVPEDVPASQFVQLAAPLSEGVPAAQSSQLDSPALPWN